MVGHSERATERKVLNTVRSASSQGDGKRPTLTSAMAPVAEITSVGCRLRGQVVSRTGISGDCGHGLPTLWL
jgi:hypothetical protein